MKIFISTLFTLFLVGSQFTSEAKTLDGLFTKEIKVKVSKLSILPDGMPMTGSVILTLDKHLIITAVGLPKTLYVFDLEENKYVYNLFTYGRGHKEILWPSSVGAHDKGLMLTVNRTIIIVDSLYKNCDRGQWNVKNLDPTLTFLSTTKLKDESYVAAGFWQDSKSPFVLLDKDFRVLQYFDDYPYKNNDDYRGCDLAMATQGHLVSYENKFSFASSYGHIIKFFELENSKIIKKKEYIFEVPKFKSISTTNTTAVGVDKNTPLGAFPGTASKNTYFFLYGIGVYQPRIRGGNIIYCFDHNGEPKQKIILDVKIEGINYSEKYNCLIGVGEDEDGEYQIYKILL
ncbi:MAG: BF3164 family lipoprotein [Rikenellaceae bacterium]